MRWTLIRMSLPVWERGLKLAWSCIPTYLRMSLPVWERGLKHDINHEMVYALAVAPRVGAWIETMI